MEQSTIAVFFLAALALAATPGPDMLLIASRSATEGRVAGLATWLGIAAGTYCHAIAAAFGLSQLFLAVPAAYEAVRWVGAAYLLYLAWQAVTKRTEAARPAEAASRRWSLPTIFRQGLLTNLLNPKMAIFVLALFPQFVQPEAGWVAGQIMVLATVLNLVGFAVNGAVILLASRARVAMAGSRKMKALSRYLLGGVFAGLALRLAFDARR
ncbi:LysE family translocator [Salipiger mangrovisoli]|nr:LysE family translocator [Salipiger mangrovisoli]